MTEKDQNQIAAALLTLAEYNIPPDIQELLLQGNPMRDVKPGALMAVISRFAE